MRPDDAPAVGMTFQRRVTRNGSSTSNQWLRRVAPYWVRLVRSGNTFSGYYSATGTAWVLMARASRGGDAVPHLRRPGGDEPYPSLVTTGTFANVTVMQDRRARGAARLLPAGTSVDRHRR